MVKKEFEKFRNIYIIFTILVAGFLTYTIVSLVKNFKEFGEISMNLTLLFRKYFSFSYLGELNLVFFIVISLVVFFKERVNDRLRLTLHFPNSYFANFSYTIFVGLTCVLVVCVVEVLVLNLVFYNFYPKEIIGVLNLYMGLNIAFGVVLYLLIGAIIVSKSRAVLNLITIFGLIYFYQNLNPDIYKLDSFYQNKFGFIYLSFSLIYAFGAIYLSFKNYKMGLK